MKFINLMYLIKLWILVFTSFISQVFKALFLEPYLSLKWEKLPKATDVLDDVKAIHYLLVQNQSRILTSDEQILHSLTSIRGEVKQASLSVQDLKLKFESYRDSMQQLNEDITAISKNVIKLCEEEECKLKSFGVQCHSNPSP